MKWTQRGDSDLLDQPNASDMKSFNDYFTPPGYIEGAENRRRLFISYDKLPLQSKSPLALQDEEGLWEDKDYKLLQTQNGTKFNNFTESFPMLVHVEQDKTDISQGEIINKKEEKESERSFLNHDKSVIENCKLFGIAIPTIAEKQENGEAVVDIEKDSENHILNQKQQEAFDSHKLESAKSFLFQNSIKAEQGDKGEILKKLQGPKFTSHQDLFENNQSNAKIRASTKTKVTKETISKFQMSLLVKKFINNMLRRSSTFVFNSVKNNPFRLLQDATYSYKDYLLQRRVNPKIFSSRVNNILMTDVRDILSKISELGTINPESTGKFVFDMISFFFILFNVIYLPIKHSFSKEIGVGQGQIEQYTLFFMMIEIYVHMSTQYYRRAILVKDRLLVIKKYISSRLWMDIIVGIPLLISVQLHDYSYLNLFYLIRVLDFLVVFNKLEKAFVRNNQLGDFLKCILLIFFVAHLSACSIHFLSTLSSVEGESSYLDLISVDRTELFQVYVYSFYWSTITMTTIGYGDIRPNSHNERIYATFFAILSCVVFGFTLNQIGSIMSNIYTSFAQFRRSQAVIDRFLKKRKVSPQLQIKVSKNLEYIHNNNDEDSKMVRAVVSTLASSLQRELKIELYSQIIENQKTFKQNFSKEFIKELALYFKEKMVSQEETIFQEKAKSDKLYFIIRGDIELFLKKKKCPITVGKGEALGIEQFFSQREWDMEAKTSRVTYLAYLEYSDFIDVLCRFPNDFETYRMIFDNSNLQGNYGRLTLKCYNCSNQFHGIDKCPYLFLSINKSLFFSKFMFQRNQEKLIAPKVSQKRRCKKKNALVEQQNVWNAVFIIFNNNEFHSFLNDPIPQQNKQDSNLESQSQNSFNSSSESEDDQEYENQLDEISETESLNNNQEKSHKSKNLKNKKKKEYQNSSTDDDVAALEKNSNQNVFFQALKNEMNKQGLRHLYSMNKDNPLLQKFFGGYGVSGSNLDISKIGSNPHVLGIEHQDFNAKHNSGLHLIVQDTQIENRPTSASFNTFDKQQQNHHETLNNNQTHSSNCNYEFKKQTTNQEILQTILPKIQESSEGDSEIQPFLSPSYLRNGQEIFHYQQQDLQIQKCKGMVLKNCVPDDKSSVLQQQTQIQQLTQQNYLNPNLQFSNLLNSNVENSEIPKSEQVSIQNDEFQMEDHSHFRGYQESSVTQHEQIRQPEQQYFPQGSLKSGIREAVSSQLILHKDHNNQSEMQFDIAIDESHKNFDSKIRSPCIQINFSQQQSIPFSKEMITSSIQKNDFWTQDQASQMKFLKDFSEAQDMNSFLNIIDSSEQQSRRQSEAFKGSTTSINVQKSSGKGEAKSNYDNDTSLNSQQFKTPPLFALTKHISQGLIDGPPLQIFPAQQSVLKELVLKSKKQNSNESVQTTRTNRTTRTQKREGTFKEFFISKLESETNEQKKIKIAQIFEKNNNFGSQKKILLDTEGQKKGKPISWKDGSPSNHSKKLQKTGNLPTLKRDFSSGSSDFENKSLPRLKMNKQSSKYTHPKSLSKQKLDSFTNRLASQTIGTFPQNGDSYFQQYGQHYEENQNNLENSHDSNKKCKIKQLKKLDYSQGDTSSRKSSSNNHKNTFKVKTLNCLELSQPSSLSGLPDQLQVIPQKKEQTNKKAFLSKISSSISNNFKSSIPIVLSDFRQAEGEEQIQESNFSILPNMDAMKMFKIYFPLNNFSKIIKNLGGPKRKKNPTLGMWEIFKNKKIIIPKTTQIQKEIQL